VSPWLADAWSSVSAPSSDVESESMVERSPVTPVLGSGTVAPLAVGARLGAALGEAVAEALGDGAVAALGDAIAGALAAGADGGGVPAPPHAARVATSRAAAARTLGAGREVIGRCSGGSDRWARSSPRPASHQDMAGKRA
jgi:hypothetical protein